MYFYSYVHTTSLHDPLAGPAVYTPRELSSVLDIAYMGGSIPPVKMKVL